MSKFFDAIRRFFFEDSSKPACLEDLPPSPPPPAKVDEVKSLITPAVRERLFALFKQWARPGIDIYPQVAETPVPLGGSKIGGCPDLPPAFEWPVYTDPELGETRPLAFMAQFNLAEVAALDPQTELPRTGLLLFFYDMASDRWGFDPQDAGCSRVVYVEDASALERGSFPEGLDKEYRFAKRAVELKPVLIPPSWGDTDEAQEQAVIDIYEQETPAERLLRDRESGKYMYAPGGIYHRLLAEWRGLTEDYYDSRSCLLGNPVLLQDEMRTECEEAARRRASGMACEDEFSEKEKEEIEAAKEDWLLLFQLASIQDEEHGDLMFDDLGNIYFWIKKEDLAARKFENAWLILQSY